MSNVRVTYGEVGLMSSIEALLNFKSRSVGNVRVTDIFFILLLVQIRRKKRFAKNPSAVEFFAPEIYLTSKSKSLIQAIHLLNSTPGVSLATLLS